MTKLNINPEWKEIYKNPSKEIHKILKDISIRREEIKEQFAKAWLSCIPNESLNIDWIINNVELVEKWSEDRMSISWNFRIKQ